MNKFISVGILLFLFSCKSVSIAQEEKNTRSKSNNTKIEKPKSDVINTTQIAPNTIHFYGEVLDVFENKTVCGRTYETAIQVIVKKVIGTGSGIVNMITLKQKIFLRLPPSVSKEKFLKEKYLNLELMFAIEEGLCMDFSQTGYEIINFRSK